MLLPPQQRERRCDRPDPIRWTDMRCVRCGRLLQKIEEHALRPGKRLEIKCGHCKVINYLVGMELNVTLSNGANGGTIDA
jgi:phage FluMu protein Com